MHGEFINLCSYNRFVELKNKFQKAFELIFYYMLKTDVIRKLDSNFILSIMGMVRSFDINEIEAIRKSVQQQMNVLLNPPADTISNTVPVANNTQGL